jgi:hypothetical protein
MKKRVAVVVAVVAMLVAAASAYAYFSSTGTGTGSATVGTSTAFTVASSAATGGPLYPDAAVGTGNIDTVNYTVTNPSAGNQNLNQVVIKVAKSDGSAWSSQTDGSKPACTAGDFSVGGENVGLSHTDTSLAANLAPSGVASSSVTVQMIDNGLNQDNCKGVTVPLYFSAS